MGLKEGLARQWEWASAFLSSEAEEQAIKAQVQPITDVDPAEIEAAKADAKAHAKTKRKEKAAKKKEAKKKEKETKAPSEG